MHVSSQVLLLCVCCTGGKPVYSASLKVKLLPGERIFAFSISTFAILQHIFKCEPVDQQESNAL